MKCSHRLICVCVAALALLLAGPAGAATLLADIPLAPNGDAIDSGRGGVVPLTSSSLLVPAEGPDGTYPSADDVVLLVQDVGATNQVTVLATPFLGLYGEIVRLSPTRAVAIANGPDAGSSSADDELLLLDGLGTTNTVTPIPIGPAYDGHSSGPLALGPDAVALVGGGIDASYYTADDEVVVVSDLGGANAVARFPAPGVQSCCTRPVGLGPDSMLLASAGPDNSMQTADDVTYFFRDLLGAATRTDIPTPFLSTFARPELLSPTRFATSSVGPDAGDGTADDAVYVIDDLGGANTQATLATPFLDDFASARVVAFGPDTAAVRGFGVDGSDQTFDDVMHVMTNLGTANDVTPVVVGPCEEDRECLMQVLGNGTGVIANFGFDPNENTPDDGITILHNVGGANTSIYLPLGAMDDRVVSQPSVIASDTVMVATGGPDGAFNAGGDDAYAIVSGIGGAISVEYFPAGGDFDNTTGREFVAAPLGGGRAAHVSSGPDNDLSDGGDDRVRVVGELPADSHLAVQKLKISAGSKGEKLKVTATLPADVAARVGMEDLTVSVGSVSAAIPASAFTVKKNSVSYKDKTQVVQSVKVSLKKGTLTVKGKGTGTGLENTDPAYVPVAVQVGDTYQAEGVAGTATSNGVKYKAPK